MKVTLNGSQAAIVQLLAMLPDGVAMAALSIDDTPAQNVRRSMAPIATTGDWVVPDSPDRQQHAEAVKPKRRRRRIGARTAYRWIGPTGRKLAAIDLTEQESEVCAYVSGLGRGQMATNRQIAQATGISNKSVESVVYRLRHMGYLQSVPVA